MAKKAVYPQWKKVAWRAFRVFMSGVLATVALMLVSVDGMEDVKPLLIAALTAGIAALGKWIREEKGLTKLPF